MADQAYAVLEGRGLLAIEGPDAKTYLQGLVSNDVNKLAPDRALYAAFLTPQGKYLHDFFLFQLGDALVLDAEAPRLADLKRRLGLYKLRSKVTLNERTNDFAVIALFGDGALTALGLPAMPGAAAPLAGGLAFTDPRLAAVGARAVLPKNDAVAALEAKGFRAAGADAYDRLRLRLGLPDGSRDLEIERSILLENGFDELNGVDWDKGCYMGQELTARTKYRGVIRKRLMPVEIEGPLPPVGTPILWQDKEVGEMRSGRDGIGLAMIRLEHLEAAGAGAPFTAGEAKVKPLKPDWATF
jgi:folate-binding protein YgfZ